jgi:hypothetical protein
MMTSLKKCLVAWEDKMYLSKKKERELIRLYPTTDESDIARILSISIWIVRKTAADLSLEKTDPTDWTQIDYFLLSENFRSMSNEELSKALKRPKAVIDHHAFRMGMRKSDAFWSNISITKEEKELLDQWNEEYDNKKYNADMENYGNVFNSRGNYVLGKILRHIFPMHTLIPEYPIGGLRIDWVIKGLQLGFEYDGIQHSEFNPFFHETKADFERAKIRDYDKSYMCEKIGLGLVRVYHNEDLTISLVKAKINEVL